MRFLGALLVFTACRIHPDDGTSPDAAVPGDGSIDSPHDAEPTQGMFVKWRATPGLPGTVTSTIAVTRATFQLAHLQVIGDYGTDARTTRARYLLTWDTESKPAQEAFPQAPIGVYSKIAMVMMNGSLSEGSYEIFGTWTDNNLRRRFMVRDRATISLAISCDETLPAAGTATLGIRVDLRDALGEINFKMLEENDDQLELTGGVQLAEFRERLKRAFELDEGVTPAL